MQVTINATIDVLRSQIEESLSRAEDNSLEVAIPIYEHFDIDPDDLSDVDNSDVIAIYNDLGDREQKSVIEQLETLLSQPIDKEGFHPSNLEEEQKLELFLQYKDRYSFEELKRRLESTLFITDMAQTGSCKYCFTTDNLSEFLDD